MTTVRVGVIGGGMWGDHHLRAARELERSGLVELVGVATRTRASADRQAGNYDILGFTDHRELLAEGDLDAVTVATPDHLHREMVMAALEAGLHVLVEKPMDTTVEGCQAMVAAAEDRGRLLTVDFHKRYDPFVLDLRDRVDAGGIGTPQYAYAYMEDQLVVPTEWLRGWAAESSPFWFLGVHKYDLVRWITGREAVWVRAHGTRDKLVGLGIDTWDSVRASIELEGGVSATIHASWVLPPTFETVVNQGLRLVGSDGVVEMDGQDRGLRHCLVDEGMTTPNPLALRRSDGPRGPVSTGYFVDPVKDFFANVGHLQAGGALDDLRGHYPDGIDGLRATQVATAVERSLVEERSVTADTDPELFA